MGFILEDILPDAKYRDMKTIMGAYLVRFILVSPSIIEIMRSLSFFGPVALLYVNSLIECLELMAHKIQSLTEFIDNYLSFNMVYKYIEIMLGDFLFLVITCDYFGTLVAISFCVVSYGKIEMLIYICLVACVFLALSITLIAFVKLKLVTMWLEEMIRSRKILAKFRYAQLKTRFNKMLHKRMISMREIRIPYGSFFYLKKEFGLEYFSNLFEHVVEIILMFDLK